MADESPTRESQGSRRRPPPPPSPTPTRVQRIPQPQLSPSASTTPPGSPGRKGTYIVNQDRAPAAPKRQKTGQGKKTKKRKSKKNKNKKSKKIKNKKSKRRTKRR